MLSVEFSRQDFNLKTRLNALEDTSIKLGSRETFFSANNSSGNSRGENDITLISDSTQPIFTCSKLLIETVEQGVKYV